MAERMAGEKRPAEDPPADADRRRYALKYDFEFAYDSDKFSDRVLRLVVFPGDDYGGLFELPPNRFYRKLMRSDVVIGDKIGGGLEGAERTDISDPDQGDASREKQVAGIPQYLEVRMPPVSTKMTQANIKWEKKEGDNVSPGEILCQVETDIDVTKIIVCVNSGYLAKTVQNDGVNEIKAGDVICMIVREESDIEKLKKADAHNLNETIGDNLDHDGKLCKPSIAPQQVEKVREIKINSAIVAAHSQFFLALFSNGMKESAEDVTTLKISDFEEALILEVLAFLYSGKLSATKPGPLLDISAVADRFGVLPLVGYCTELLMNLPMTDEEALMYLHHPYTPEVVIRSAEEYLIRKYQNLTRIPEEFLDMPIIAIETIFSNSQMRIESEDRVYDFLLKWAYKQYPDEEERLTECSSRLLPLMRFSNMSQSKLQAISTGSCDCLDLEETLKHIGHALSTSVKEPQREYTHKPIRVVAFGGDCPQAILFFSLKRDECSQLYPAGQVHSQTFVLGGQELYLSACCDQNQETGVCYFGLWVGMLESQNASGLTMDIKFAVRDRQGKFLLRFQERRVLTSDERQGTSDLFDFPWTMFLADDDLFIDDELQIRAEITLVDE